MRLKTTVLRMPHREGGGGTLCYHVALGAHRVECLVSVGVRPPKQEVKWYIVPVTERVGWGKSSMGPFTYATAIHELTSLNSGGVEAS